MDFAEAIAPTVPAPVPMILQIAPPRLFPKQLMKPNVPKTIPRLEINNPNIPNSGDIALPKAMIAPANPTAKLVNPI
jgi:hypothetical protein